MTTEDRLDRLETELTAIKQRNRLLYALACVAFLGWIVTGVLLAHQRKPAVSEEIRAEKFTLVDGKGNMRAVLETEKGKWPRLLFFDENDSIQVNLSGSNRGPFVELTKEKAGRLSMGIVGKGPKLFVFDANDKLRVMLTAEQPGTNLTFMDENEKSRAVFGAGGGYELNDMVYPYPTSSIRLYSPDGKIIWKAPESPLHPAIMDSENW